MFVFFFSLLLFFPFFLLITKNLKKNDDDDDDDMKRQHNFHFSDSDAENSDVAFECEINPRPWLASSEFAVPSGGQQQQQREPLRVLCPIQRTEADSYYVNDRAECGLFKEYPGGYYHQVAYETYKFWQARYVENIRQENTCIAGSRGTGFDKCAGGGRLDYHFWAPESLGGAGNAPSLRRSAAFEASPLRLHRLPAIRIEDIEPHPSAPERRMLASPDRSARSGAASVTSDAYDGDVDSEAVAEGATASSVPPARSCRASWSKDGTVPIRCGVDKTRFIIARVGAGGKSDRDSWPTIGADNRTATTAVVELFATAAGDLRVRCTPRWRRKDQSPPASVALTPLVTSAVVTFAEGPVYNGESSLAWATNATEVYYDATKDPLDSLSFDESLRTTSTASQLPPRRLPRVISCLITADDPGNNGLPVYVTGTFVALTNASAPLGVELRSYSYPLAGS